MVTRDTRQTPPGLMLVEVFVDVENGHELKALKTKLWKYGFIRREECDYGRDKWGRPAVARARFIVVVPTSVKQPFKAMLTSQQTKSKITYDVFNYV